MAKALLEEIAATLGGKLGKRAVRGSFEGMRYTVELGEKGPSMGPAASPALKFGGGGILNVYTVMRRVLQGFVGEGPGSTGKRLVGKVFNASVTASIELMRMTDKAFDAREVPIAVRGYLRGLGVDRGDFTVSTSSTRLTIVLRKNLATSAMMCDCLKVASASAEIERRKTI